MFSLLSFEPISHDWPWCHMTYMHSSDVGVHGVIVDAPTIIQTEGLGARVLRVRWTLVNSDASNPVSGYRINASTSTNETSVAFVQEVGPNQTSFIFHGLSPYQYRGTPGVTYTVSLVAFNEDGDGPASDSHPVLLPRKQEYISRMI